VEGEGWSDGGWRVKGGWRMEGEGERGERMKRGAPTFVDEVKERPSGWGWGWGMEGGGAPTFVDEIKERARELLETIGRDDLRCTRDEGHERWGARERWGTRERWGWRVRGERWGVRGERWEVRGEVVASVEATPQVKPSQVKSSQA
jgi:hypothetical protein